MGVTFNCSTSFINVNFEPNVYLNSKNIIFVKKVKYLGVLLENNLKDGIDINRQVRSFYYTANKLKARFSKCSTFVKNVLFRSFCYGMNACQLWSLYYQYSLKRVRITYNNTYRILHGIPRWVSVREAQVVDHICTFDALLRKNAYSFE